VIVSGGLGCSIMPFRLGVPPEIVEVTLGRESALSS
jgi:predicted MPP superfamily phosphohydrolase